MVLTKEQAKELAACLYAVEEMDQPFGPRYNRRDPKHCQAIARKAFGYTLHNVDLKTVDAAFEIHDYMTKMFNNEELD